MAVCIVCGMESESDSKCELCGGTISPNTEENVNSPLIEKSETTDNSEAIFYPSSSEVIMAVNDVKKIPLLFDINYAPLHVTFTRIPFGVDCAPN